MTRIARKLWLCLGFCCLNWEFWDCYAVCRTPIRGLRHKTLEVCCRSNTPTFCYDQNKYVLPAERRQTRWRPTFIYQLNNLTAPGQPALAGTLYLRVALLILRAIFQPDFLAQLPLLVGWLAQLTREYLAVEYVNTVLRYVTSVRKEVTVPVLRQALRAAAVADKETLMTSWVEDLSQQGELQGEQKGRTAEARRLITRQIEHRFGPLTASVSHHLERLSLDQLEALSTFMLDAHSLAEIEAYLKRVR